MHLLRGNPSDLSKAELAEREELRARPIAPQRPRDLSPLERECWDLHAPDLERLNLLSVLDVGSFRLLCQAYGLAMECREAMRPKKSDGSVDLRRRGFEVVVPDGAGSWKKHPAFTEWRQAAAEYRSWAVEFGLTPSARIGLRPSVPFREESNDDSDEGFDFGC